MKKVKNSIFSDQRGLVSVIVTMVLIILMTLVVLAMSQNSNREQRQALDRQLSDQAFFNAESGINDWASYLYGLSNPNAADIEKTECAPPEPPISGLTSNIDDGVNSYTCVLYDRAPITLEYDNLTTSDSVVMPIAGYNSGIDTITIEWRAHEGDTNLTSDCNIPTDGSRLPEELGGCNVGGVRIDLVDPTGNRQQRIDENFISYLAPSDNASGGSLTYNSAKGVQGQGRIISGSCGASPSGNGNSCRVTITGMAQSQGDRRFLHMRSLYNTVDITITGTTGSDPVRFEDAQLMLDVTGKANDILRRVQVRLPAQSQFENAGSFSLKTTQHICKLITVTESDSEASTSASISEGCPGYTGP